jgi:polysaccharide biosynthesis transport protein
MAEHISDEQGERPRLNLDITPELSVQGLDDTLTRSRANRKDNGPQPLKFAAPGDAYAGYGSAGTGSAGDVHLLDYVRILHKRRWTAGTAFLLVFGSVTIYTFTSTPVFEGRTLIQIENQEQKVVQFQQALDETRANDYYQTQYRILQSRLLARRTLDAEKLWDQAARSASSSRFSLNPISWLKGGVHWVGGFFTKESPNGIPEPGETAEQSAAIDRFLQNLTVAPVRNSRLVEVRYRSENPQLAAQAANALARQYIEQNLEFKFLSTKEATEFLSARMKEQRKSLEQSEQALQKYREQTGAVALQDRQNIVIQRLSDLNAAVTRARTERIEKEAVYNQVRDAQNNRALLDTAPAILSNSFIQQLKAQQAEQQRQQAQLSEKLGERHPEMVKLRSSIESTDIRMQAEIQKVVRALQNDYQAALANERALMSSLDQQRGEAQELNRSAIQAGVLERDTNTNRQMFEGLLQRTKESDVAGELRTSNIRVVDRAEVPRSPASPNVRSNIILATLGGLFLAVGLAFFFEYLDNRIKSPEQIKSQLGLAYLGMIPSIDTKALPGAPLVSNAVPPHFSEAIRSIRTNVLFSSAEPGSKSLVVTSTGPGEGKTVVSANLAISLAAAGQRVLLIDGDMRRPKIHEFFRLRSEPGLSNVLVGDGKASDAVKKVPVPNLWIMAAGKQPPNPAELLGSRRFKEFLSSLGDHFDWVLVDTPPVMAVTDASLVGHIADGLVFVIGSEMTGQGAARAALDHLDAAKVKYLGGILNRVDLTRNAYYYSTYYKRAYSEYYTQRKETAR